MIKKRTIKGQLRSRTSAEEAQEQPAEQNNEPQQKQNDQEVKKSIESVLMKQKMRNKKAGITSSFYDELIHQEQQLKQQIEQEFKSGGGLIKNSQFMKSETKQEVVDKKMYVIIYSVFFFSI